MNFDVILTEEAHNTATKHLLQHYEHGEIQEDLCFALWRPSTGNQRTTALIDGILLPEFGERNLHGNASFEPTYMARAITIAREKNAGVAFMHSHPGPGWQGMSSADVEAEQDVLAYPAGATGLPLVGLTIGRDGYWSARFWQRDNRKMHHHWCENIRVLGVSRYQAHFNDSLVPIPARRNILRRTFDTWGQGSQNTIARLKIGIVGLGSVGCVVAESMARIGIKQITLIDPDRVEEHNLDRLMYATTKDIGRLKVELAAEKMRCHATAEDIEITTIPLSIQHDSAYKAALDCDILFSCVDRPIPRDVLNYIAQAHLIPVIDGGVAVEFDHRNQRLFSAHWRAHLVTPYHQCLRCSGQYTSGMVITELDGSLDDPSYIENLPSQARASNQNVFPFSQSIASMQVNLMLRYLIAADWWPAVQRQEYQFLTAEMHVANRECYPNCTFRQRRALGDQEEPFYLISSDIESTRTPKQSMLGKIFKTFGRLFARS